MKSGAQIDRDDCVPALGRKRFDGRHVLNAGVVDQNIDLPELGLGRVHHLFDLLRLAHVGGVIQSSNA